MAKTKQPPKWQQTKATHSILGVAQLALAYGFISLAIDHGNLWFYLLTIVFLTCSLQNLATLLKRKHA